MKCYSDFKNGATLPQEPQIVIEGNLTRLFFDFEKEVKEDMDGTEYDVLVCENVDVRGGRSYGDLVSAIVIDRYPADERDAIFANYEEAKDETSDLTDEKRAEYLAEYADYQSWRKHAKEIASYAVEQLAKA